MSGVLKLFIGDVSFEGADTERTIVIRQVGFRRFFPGRRRWRRIRWLIFGHSLQKRFRRNKEKASRNRTAEVENPVIVARRPSNEHILEHLLDRARRTAVADKMGT